MEENTVDTNTLQKNNLKVFRNGLYISLLGTLLPTCAALNWFVYNYDCRSYIGPPGPDYCGFLIKRAWTGSMGSPLIVPLNIFIIYVEFILGVAVIQLVIYFIFKLLNRRNIEISGTKKTIFYAIEFVVALTPYVIIWASNHV